jgi:hypothetical protein
MRIAFVKATHNPIVDFVSTFSASKAYSEATVKRIPSISISVLLIEAGSFSRPKPKRKQNGVARSQPWLVTGARP